MNREQKLKVASVQPPQPVDTEVFTGEMSKVHAKFTELQETTLKLIDSIGKSDDVKLQEQQERLIDVNNNLVQVITQLEANSNNKEVLEAIKGVLDKELPSFPDIPAFPSKIKIDNPTTIPSWLAKNSTIEATNTKLAQVVAAVKAAAPKPQGQTVGDFVPMRRVRLDGRTLKFDDSSWAASSGGGGGGNASNDSTYAGPGLVYEKYDYISRTLTNSTTETYVYKTGGSGGTTVATVTVVYTDSTLQTISTVTRS